MAFAVDQSPVNTLWMPLDATAASTLFSVGQLTKMDTGSFNGLAPLAAASGVADTSQLQAIHSVVIGTNDATATYNGTYGQYIQTTQTETMALQNARKCLGNSGMFMAGDQQPLVKVALLNATTVLRGDIYNATVGTAPSVVTVTTGSATGAGMTTGAIDFTPVANMNTFYCRTGANAGLYRISKTTSTTVHTFDTCWPYPIAVGDTFVAVPMRVGTSYVQITSTASYIGMGFNCASTPATNYFLINVLELRLRTAGMENVIFQFAPCHFDKVRA